MALFRLQLLGTSTAGEYARDGNVSDDWALAWCKDLDPAFVQVRFLLAEHSCFECDCFPAGTARAGAGCCMVHGWRHTGVKTRSRQMWLCRLR